MGEKCLIYMGFAFPWVAPGANLTDKTTEAPA